MCWVLITGFTVIVEYCLNVFGDILIGSRGLKVRLKQRIRSYSESMTVPQPQTVRRKTAGSSSEETEEEILQSEEDSLSEDASDEDGSSLDEEIQASQALSIGEIGTKCRCSR